MSQHRCLRCNGTKKIAPLGGILKTCDICNGLGYVVAADAKEAKAIKPYDSKDITPNANIAFDDANPVILHKKKPGRKKGWNLPKPDTLQTAPQTATINE